MCAKTLEASIDSTRRELDNPTEVELELKRRLGQLTDHLIQKQAQVGWSNNIVLPTYRFGHNISELCFE